jgi:energy-coupling factor transport system ATP-binding protein
VIRFEDASFHYGGDHGTGEGVDDIELDIADGEFVVFCGPSGCGKTTLTRMINGLAPHFYSGEMEGKVSVDDICVSEEPLAVVARHVGSVFQNPKSQFFNVDSTGELAFGCENQNMGRALIAQRLQKTQDDLQLDALMDRNIFELSGGEKQQIAVGSAYATQPQVYVLDEPSSNLDKKAIQRLHDILKKIKENKKTLVVAEHRIFYLMDLADRFIYLDDGRIVRSYSADELRELSDAKLEAQSLRTPDLRRLQKSKQAQAVEPSQASALEAIDLQCTRGGNQILDIDRLAVPQGSVIALIGDNGCGKSTLAESLCGILPASGSIAFMGSYLDKKERSKNSFMVMQDVNRQLFADSVLDEVRMLSKTTEQEAQTVLDTLGIGDLRERHPASLSGGQKQRVAIACAICAKKEIVFYDEPTSGLDRGGMERFGKVLQWAKGKAKTSVIVTHDPELILACCTHVMYMENGRVQSFYPLSAEGTERLKLYFLSVTDKNFSKKREKIGLFTKIFQYAGSAKKTIVLAAIFMLIGAAASVAPYILAYGLISAVVAGEQPGLQAIGASLLLILLCEALYAVCYSYGLKLSHKAAFATLENLRCSLQEKLQRQPLGSILDRGSGAIKKVIVEDVESIELLLAHMVPEGIANLLVVALALLAMVAVDWQLALMAAIVIGLGVSVSGQMMAVGMDKMGDYFAASKRLNNAIIEYVNGMEVVRVFNRQGEQSRKYQKTVKEYHGFALAWFKVCWPWMALYGSIFAQITLYSVPLGALLIVLGQLTLSNYILVVCLSFGIGPLLMHCIGFIGAMPQVNYKIQAIEKAMDQPPLRVGEKSFAGKDHTIEFADVYFSYRDDEVLKGVSFTAKEAEMTALVGQSGGGKSTIAQLAVHYYDVSSGIVAIGGQPITDISLEELNSQISYVSQSLFLFNKSIGENIRVGRPDATDAEVKAAAQKACCDDFIREFAQGYDTMVGAAGMRLSGGQRQRIAFARAILKDAPIIILDEATAYMDPENENKMCAAIAALTKDKTVITIVHKLQNVRAANKIIVLEKGSILDQGSHDDLLLRCQTYQKLWAASQSAAKWSLTGQGRGRA